MIPDEYSTNFAPEPFFHAETQDGNLTAGSPATERPMSLPNDRSRCLTEFDPRTTLIAVVELSLSSWLIAGLVPGVEWNPAPNR